ncbi:MAG: DUF2382 domain-containing protein [Kofleriaceae bacterium]
MAELMVDPESQFVTEVVLENGARLSAHDLVIGDRVLILQAGVRDMGPAKLSAVPAPGPGPEQRTAEREAERMQERETERLAERAPEREVERPTVRAEERPTERLAEQAAKPKVAEIPPEANLQQPEITERSTTSPAFATAPTGPTKGATEAEKMPPRVARPAAAAATEVPICKTVTEDFVLQLADEELEVSKRQFSAGGVHLETHIISEPITQEVVLREEHVQVERMRVDRPIADSDAERFLHDEMVEMSSKAELPVVDKQAHVVEEIHLRRMAEEHVERIRDTVRHTDADITQLPPDAELQGVRR